MNVDKKQMITTGASLAAGVGGAVVGGPAGAVAAAGAAGYVTNRYLEDDSSSKSN